MAIDSEPRQEDLTPGELEDYSLSGEEGGETQAGSDDPFFVSKKAAAVFKHKLLKTYFPKFAGKAGSTEADKRLVYVDTHAGRGAYDDGTAGSPLLVAQDVAMMQQLRRIDCFFVEARKSNYTHLDEVLTRNMPDGAHWHTRHGRASDHLQEALTFAGDSPLFMFIDPYGLGPTFDEVVTVLNRPRSGYGRKTEVLLNFISMAFSRAGGYLRRTEKSAQQVTTLERLDAVLGGDWWRVIYLASESTGPAIQAIALGYAERIQAKTNCFASLIPVRDRAHNDPLYWLAHFTHHPDGVWWIRESAAYASEAWRRHCSPPPPGDDNGLFSIEDPFITEEDARHAGWIDTIEQHARALLRERGAIELPRDALALFGPETYGQAWSKHLRGALARLHKEGILDPKPYANILDKYKGCRVQHSDQH
ncbi:hypothetical protein Amsp01_050200 [Amycolatopsis sp. NBRC 101858]|uniref:three-Cys-motif partner protein TcmP n=1 Tax=Amycolatopsis sp. NBRC 101858 TaxID=3032200 RepID=UPI0024A54174|nr:three-Cys-motif partner protein TcmP [Amycolatopsis sp. NBRC 101858]GLY38996.1 hypothetical protein Amsp01_050200 [Amycolatopsis sp. NBRC 101858]